MMGFFDLLGRNREFWAVGWVGLGVHWETTAWMVVLVVVLFTCSVLFLYALFFSPAVVLFTA